MCGIAGVFCFDRQARIDRDVFVAQTESLAHRGPDAGGVWLGPGAALGHRRLSIIDLEGGQQPLWDAEGRFAVVFNGEIYNYRGLREQLVGRGHAFSSASDTEVLLAAYREWGEACVERLEGMFAFCLYDRREHRAFLARDRLGKKPLFYFQDGSRLVFGSELKAILLDPSVPRELEPTAVVDYFAYGYVPAPGSILKKIYKLEAGFTMQLSAAGVRLRRYWDPPIDPQAPGPHLAEAAEALLDTIQSAVGLRLRSDVPLGAFLSGGVDSSLVVALMSKAGAAPVKTHTIGFQEQAYDERRFARETAELYGAEHSEAVVSPDAVQLVDALSWFYDEPFADASAVPTYYLCGSTRAQVTVALSGDGGDESFAGYRRYRFARGEDRVRARLPRRLRRHLIAPLARHYPKADFLPRYLRAKSTLANLAADHDRAYFLSLTQKTYPRFLSPTLLRELDGYDPYHHFQRHLARCPTQDPLARMQYVDLKMYLCDDILVKVDRASMAHALEVRVPLLDPRVVAFAGRLPESLKLGPEGGKRVLKAAAGQLLPKSVLTRPKQGFVLPLPEWFRGPLAGPAQEVFFGQPGGASGLIHTPGLRRMWYEHQLKISNHATVLWSLLMFERWAARFLRRQPSEKDAVLPRAAAPAQVVDTQAP